MKTVYLFVVTSIFFSCTEKPNNLLIGPTEESQIKEILIGNIDDYQLSEFERCYFKKYISELNLKGTYYDVIHQGALIKYMFFEDLGFYYSIIKIKNEIYFVGYQALLYATRHYNEVVRNQTYNFEWKAYSNLNSAEIRSLNSVLSSLTSLSSNREIGSLINKIYAIEVRNIPSTHKSVFDYITDADSIEEWIREHYSMESERNELMMSELEVAEVHDFFSNSFILSSSIYGLYHYRIEEVEEGKEISCNVLFSNFPHDFYISGNDVTIVSPGDCNNLPY